MSERKYKQRLRAQQARHTRERIVKATVRLHGTLGPARTSIKAIAEEAGVQRLTVYRHFPDEISLFQACTGHWFDRHPLPFPDEGEIADAPAQALKIYLESLYAYYRENEAMLYGAYRDIREVEALQAPMAAAEALLHDIAASFMASMGTGVKQDSTTALTLRHVLKFTTWHSLSLEQLSDREMASLVITWLPALSATSGRSRRRK